MRGVDEIVLIQVLFDVVGGTRPSRPGRFALRGWSSTGSRVSRSREGQLDISSQTQNDDRGLSRSKGEALSITVVIPKRQDRATNDEPSCFRHFAMKKS